MLQEIGMLQEMLKEDAAKIMLDKDLLQRAQASGKRWYRRDYIDNHNLKLLLTFTLTEDANCIDIGAHKGVRAFDLRRSRYIGLAKTRLHHVSIATAINFVRIAAWFRGEAPAPTHVSAFERLFAIA